MKTILLLACVQLVWVLASLGCQKESGEPASIAGDGALPADAASEPSSDLVSDPADDPQPVSDIAEAVEPERLLFVGCEAPVDLAAAPERRFVIAPYLIHPQPGSVRIQWEALDDGPAYLLWGPEGGLDTCICAPAPVKIPIVSEEIVEEHDGWLYSVTLDGLESGESHQYSLVGASVPVPDPRTLSWAQLRWEDFGVQAFSAPPAAGEPFTMMVYGDNQPIPALQEPVIKAMGLQDGDLVLHTGDIVHNGLSSEYRFLYFLIASPLARAVPHLYTSGNHEGHGEVIPFDSFFPVPGTEPVEIDGAPVSPGPRSGMLELGNARIFVLDSEREMGEGSEQLRWLDHMLERTARDRPDIRWLFASWHRPTHTWAESIMLSSREALHEVMCRWKVDVVWNGHNHCYEHFEQDGVTYIVTGGGGALLTPIDGRPPEPGDNRLVAESSYHLVLADVGHDSIEIQAIRATDLNMIDRFTVLANDRGHLR